MRTRARSEVLDGAAAPRADRPMAKKTNWRALAVILLGVGGIGGVFWARMVDEWKHPKPVTIPCKWSPDHDPCKDERYRCDPGREKACVNGFDDRWTCQCWVPLFDRDAGPDAAVKTSPGVRVWVRRFDPDAGPDAAVTWEPLVDHDASSDSGGNGGGLSGGGGWIHRWLTRTDLPGRSEYQAGRDPGRMTRHR